MPKIKTIKYENHDGGSFCRRGVLKALKEGKVVVLPTDTIYGLSCLADNKKTIQKIKIMKGREANKALIVLVSSISMLKKYVFLSKKQEIIAAKFWQELRPTTLVLKHKNILPRELSGDLSTLAIRLPKSDFLIKIIKRAGKPLVSTSLNLSGKEALSDLSNIDQYFHKNPDLLVDAGKIKNKKASRLIDLSNEDKIVVLRK